MSSRRKATTPCMIRPEVTAVDLDEEEGESYNVEVILVQKVNVYSFLRRNSVIFSNIEIVILVYLISYLV